MTFSDSTGQVPTIVVRRKMRGVIIRGFWTPLPIIGGDGSETRWERLDREARELFPEAAKVLRTWEDRARSQLAALYRPDGQPRYGDAEHDERLKAILEDFDTGATRVTEQANAAAAQAQQELAQLDASDGWERLNADEQSQASLRRPFVQEDVMELPSEQLVELVRATMGSKDRGAQYLIARYLPRRIAAMPDRTPARIQLSTLNHELSKLVADPKASETRAKLELRIERAKWLAYMPTRVRQSFDGTRERMTAHIR